MNNILEFIQAFLMEPALLIGFMVFIGYLLAKKPIVKTITGTFSAIVGLMMILFGGNQFSSTFKPVATAVSNAFGIKGYLMDPYAMRATTQEALGTSFGMVGYVFLIAFAVNILLVMFGKYTKAKGIFLTGNTGLAHSQAVLWLVIFWFGANDIISAVIAGVIIGIYWAYSTTLAFKATQKVTGGAGFTVGHNQTVGIWFFSKISKYFGDPEKEDAENIKLPGWLSIFNHNVTSVAIIMTLFVGGFLLTIGVDSVQKLAGTTHWVVYIINLGLSFSMYMVILLTGVRMLVGEINGAFKGIQDKLIPNAVPAVDVAAILPFSQNAATLGFIFCTLGTVLSIGVLVAVGSSIIVLPGFVPLFFAGGPIGVVANKYGGIKSVMISCTLLGIIQTFGTVWAVTLMGAPNGIGWVGMFDWATVWPAITEVFKFIAGIFGLGPFA